MNVLMLTSAELSELRAMATLDGSECNWMPLVFDPSKNHEAALICIAIMAKEIESGLKAELHQSEGCCTACGNKFRDGQIFKEVMKIGAIITRADDVLSSLQSRGQKT